MRSARAALRGSGCAALLAALSLSGCGAFDDEQAKLERAQRSIAAGEWRTANVDLRALLAANPDHLEARLKLAEVSIALGDHETALRSLERAEEIGAPPGATLLPTLTALAALGRYQEVVGTPQPQGLIDEAQLGAFWRIRGQSLAALGRYDGALRALDAALAADPNDAEARATRVLVVLELEGVEAADRELARVQAEFPGNVHVAVAGGGLHLRAGRYDHAAQAFAAATAADAAGRAPPTEVAATAFVGWVDALLASQSLAEADTVTAAFQQHSPNSLAAAFQRARYLVAARKLEEARQLLEQVVAGAPQLTRAQGLLGAVLFAEGRVEQAEMYLAAAAKDPADTVSARLLMRLRLERAASSGVALSEDLLAAVDEGLLATVSLASLRSGNREVGLEYFERSTRAAPTELGSVLPLAARFIGAGETDLAIALLERGRAVGDDAEQRHREALLLAARLRAGDTNVLGVAEALARRYPDDVLIRGTWATLLVAAGDVRRGRAEAAATLAAHSDSPLARVMAARVELLAGAFDSAEAHLEPLLRGQQRDAVAMLTAAQLEASRGNASAAEQWLLEVERAEPSNVDVRLLRARRHIAAGELEAGLKAALEGQAVSRDDPRPVVLAASVLTSMGRTAEAVEIVRAALRHQPEAAVLRASLAQQLLAAGRSREAMAEAEASLEIERGAPALAVGAAAALQLGDTDKARSFVAELNERGVADPVVTALEAEIELRTGQFRAAAEHYAAAATQSGNALFAIREYQARQLGGLPEPTQSLETWLEHKPQDLTIRLVLADARLLAGAVASAVADYEAVLAVEPNRAVALHGLARAQSVAQDPRAAATAARAYAVAPDDAAIADTYGSLLANAGRFDEAEPVLRNAVLLSRRQPDVVFHLAYALARVGKRDEARNLLTPLLAGPESFASRAQAEQLVAALGPGAASPQLIL